MHFILGLALLIGMAYAASSAWDHAAKEYRRSREARVAAAEKAAAPRTLPASHRRKAVRRHAVGWWAREAGHGFPVTRTGWHAGWLAHRTAVAHQKAVREEARTTHLDAEASFLAGLKDHRERQAAARADIGKALAEAGQQSGGRKAVQEAGAKILPFRKREPAASVDPPPEPDPAVRNDARPDDSDWLQPGDTRCRTCGGRGRKPGDEPPATCPDCKGFGWEYRPLPVNGQLPAAPPEGSTKAAPQAASPPATEGNPVTTATDTNYTEVLRQAQQIERDADDAVNDIRWQRMGNTVDSLGALLSGDTASLSEASEVADALREEQKAMAQVRDAAAAFVSGLKRRHGGIKEAADSAPIAQPAAPEFYVD
jgi:hypothetical protein